MIDSTVKTLLFAYAGQKLMNCPVKLAGFAQRLKLSHRISQAMCPMKSGT